MTFWDSGPFINRCGDGKLKPSFRHGWISDMMDQKRPSLILDFCEEGGEATRYFATVLVPVKSGKTCEPSEVCLLINPDLIWS